AKQIAEANARLKAARDAEKEIAKEARAREAAEEKLAKLAKQTSDLEKKATEAAKSAKANEKALAEVQAAEQKRQAEQAREKARQDSLVNAYALKIRDAIESNWMYPSTTGKRTCLLALSLAPTGQVLDARLVKSSGDDSIDRLAIAAVYKSSPLPVPKDSGDFAPFRQINLTVSTHG
ncbi:MAG: tolA, partial [Gammaproteobacteria bacterium]|nr:tolA [Gammaproteobacteria bacterium]